MKPNHFVERWVERVGFAVAVPFFVVGELIQMIGHLSVFVGQNLPCWLRLGHDWTTEGSGCVVNGLGWIPCSVCGTRKTVSEAYYRAFIKEHGATVNEDDLVMEEDDDA